MTDKQAEGDQRIVEWLGLCWHERDKVRSPVDGRLYVFVCQHCGDSDVCDWPHPDYSTPKDCLALIEAVRAKGYAWSIGADSVKWQVDIYTAFTVQAGQQFKAEADTLPEAVSNAVLALVESRWL